MIRLRITSYGRKINKVFIIQKNKDVKIIVWQKERCYIVGFGYKNNWIEI